MCGLVANRKIGLDETGISKGLWPLTGTGVSTSFLHMPSAIVDIAHLNTGQKVALMEELWASMIAETESQGPPDWHESELQMRQDEWDNRESVAEDWKSVREELMKGSV